MGRKDGLGTEKLQALEDFEISRELDDLEKLCLRYAVAMTETPVDVSKEISDELGERFGEPEIVELTSAIAWENYRARFNHALHIGSAGLSEGSYCPLPQRPASAVR